jgi:hypothetical protein
MPVRTAVFVVIAFSALSPLLPRALVLDAQAPATAQKRWNPPRTPWGDPDLQGVYTNDNEYATPLERPGEFDGKTLADVTSDEMARVRASALQQMVSALPGGRVRGPDEWWIQNLDLSKRSQPWLIVDPPDGHIPPLTAEAQKRPPFARGSFVGGPFNSPADFSLLDRCITRSVPGSMIPVMYSNVYDIVQAPGLVAITYEIVHEARVIPLDNRAHIGPAIHEHMGDARGHWEGDTLVVDATNFTAAAAYRGANPARLRIVEHFTPVSPDTIAWTATLDDPTTWTRPWTIGMPLHRAGSPSLPFECHEGNYGLRNILSAARAEERGKN